MVKLYVFCTDITALDAQKERSIGVVEHDYSRITVPISGH